MNKQRAESEQQRAESGERRASGAWRPAKGITQGAEGNEQRAAGKGRLFALWGVLLAAGLMLSAHGTFAQGNLAFRSKEPDVCYKCHPQLKEALSQKHVHFVFKQGKCSSCHNPHVSNIKGLMRDEVNDLCLSCHENTKKLLKKTTVHGAISRGKCTDCHAAHGSSNKHLLAKPEKELCWSCHGSLKDSLNKASVHQPFKQGECSACHNAHGSSERNLLTASPSKECKSCHSPRCSAGGVSITFATKDMDCTSCHSGHSSQAKGLLGPYGHTAFLDRKCEQCHTPFAANKPITTKLEGEKLCFSCHQKDPAKFRENDVHGSGTKNSCAMCHSSHASDTKSLTTGESGICLTCHESTGKKITAMAKMLKNIKCAPVRDRQCFECHIPMHSSQPRYFRADPIKMCSRCHETQHKISHPLGEGTLDPRTEQTMTCLSCHSLHDAKADFMLQFDRKRQLCIQCHKRA